MGKCRSCNREAPTISNRIGFCVSCLRNYWGELEPEINKLHSRIRRPFKLPPIPPRDKDGLTCRLCFHRCRILHGKSDYCGIRANREGNTLELEAGGAYVSWYLDPLSTNCVGDFVCAGVWVRAILGGVIVLALRKGIMILLSSTKHVILTVSSAKTCISRSATWRINGMLPMRCQTAYEPISLAYAILGGSWSTGIEGLNLRGGA